MGDTMSSMTGKQEFQNPRKDGVNELMVNKGLIKEYRDFTERCFQDITPEEQQRVYGLFGDADPLSIPSTSSTSTIHSPSHSMASTDLSTR